MQHALQGKVGAAAPLKRPSFPLPEPTATDDDDDLLWDYG